MTAARPALFDTHAHFFSSDTARYPIDVAGAREGEDAITSRIANAPLDARTLLGLWDQTGVTGGAAVQYNTVYKTDNRYALAVGDRHADRAATVLILNAADPSSPYQVRRLASEHNVSGLRLFGYPDGNGEYPWLDSPAARKTWDVAAEMGLTMVVMYAPGQPNAQALQRIAALARAYDPMPIAVDHCGWAGCEEGGQLVGPAHRALADVATVYFKFTQINFNRLAQHRVDPRDFLEAMLDVFGPNRVMWGSDAGNTLISYQDMVAQVLSATARLDRTVRQRVLHDNGRDLFFRRRGS